MSKKHVEQEQEVAPDDLVAMTKDGEQIEVCAGQVAQHEALGWQVA